jgi:hypothetical protein
MMSILRIIVLFTAAISMFNHQATYSSQSYTYKTTRQLLLELNGVHGKEEQLARLFKQGDDRITDLIRALDDPDKVVSRNAQVTIRYLGSDIGMRAMIQAYGRGGTYVMAGPVPLPLRDWDYEYIRNYYLKGSPWDHRTGSYIYALALDESPKARTLLDQMIQNAKKDPKFIHIDLDRVEASPPKGLLSGQGDLAKMVLESAFFIAPQDRKDTSARLLGLNGAEDKAIVEVHINRGPLAEEWYHVVVRKCDQGWKFFSITKVAQS